MPAHRPLELRFWEKVRIGSIEECWPWTGCTQPSAGGPYGRVRMPRQRRTEYAHRVAFVLSGREIPNDRIVCHRCGNSLCVNPWHLYAGTPTDNNLDRLRHGRQAGGARSGEHHHMAKLTNAQTAEIRRRIGAGETGTRLATEFGISQTQVSRIKKKEQAA